MMVASAVPDWLHRRKVTIEQAIQTSLDCNGCTVRVYDYDCGENSFRTDDYEYSRKPIQAYRNGKRIK